jgi:hypothetical protein
MNCWYRIRVTIPSSHLERVMTSPEVECDMIGTLYGNRTRLCDLKGHCPKPIDEQSIKLGRGNWIRTNDDDFKDRCLRPLGDTPT